MELADNRVERTPSLLRCFPSENSNPLGLKIDAAALAWLKLQSQDRLATRHHAPSTHAMRLHPLSFLKILLEQIHDHKQPTIRALLKESFLAKRIPSQHLFDHHFTRSLKYLSKIQQIKLSQRIIPLAGDIVIFSQEGNYTQLQWAICGSAQRLYYVDQVAQRIVCTPLTYKLNTLQILEL